jgi:CHAT domain-containing protein/Tfp pilus assembly protein PilF
MRNLLFAALLLSLGTYAQQNDTTFYNYVDLADSAYAHDDVSLKALTWYATAISMANNNPGTYEKPRLAHTLERAGEMSYSYQLYDYAMVFYNRALVLYRELENKDARLRVIPKVAKSYSAMRKNNMNLRPPEADEFETAEVYYRVDAVEYQNRKAYARINGGITDGIYPTSVGYAYGAHRSDFEDRSNISLGDAAIYALDTNNSIVEIDAADTTNPFYKVYQNDMVMMLSRIPKREYHSIFWDLALDQIVFLNESQEPIYDYRQLLYSDSQVLEQDILEIMRLDVLSTYQWLSDLDDRSQFTNIFEDTLQSGRYKGHTVFTAMGKTTQEDIRSFLGFVKVFPGKYMGKPWKINETYATWVLNECPIGFDEFFGYLMEAETDADYQKLIDLYYEEITDDEFHVRANMAAEDFAKKGDYENALAINKRVVKLSQFIPDSSYMGWAYFNKGRIYDYDDNSDSTLHYYIKANAIFMRTGDTKGQSFCLNNIGSLYDDLGQYQKANGYYRKAQAAKIKLLNDPTEDRANLFYSLAKSSSGIGNTEYNLANYDSATAAYNRGIGWCDSTQSLEGKEYAVALQTDLARVFKKRGEYDRASEIYRDQLERYRQLGKRDEMADSYDNLADVLFSFGEYRNSYNMYFDAYDIKFELEDWSGAGFSLSNSAQAMWNLGNLDSAIFLHEEAIKLRQLGEDKRGEAYAYAKIAALYKELGEPEKASMYYDQAIKTYADYGDSLKVASLALDIGDLFEGLKNYTRALQYYEYARNIYARRDMKSDIATVDAYQGYVYYALKDFSKAEELYRKALATRKAINERQSIMYSLVDLSTIELYANYNLDTTLVLLNTALELAKETGSSDYEAYCHEYIGHAYYFRAETDKAKENYNIALELYEDNENITGQCNMLVNLGANELERGEFDVAYEYYSRSLKLAKDKRLTVQVANTYNYLSEYYYYTGEFSQSFNVIDSSYRLFEEAENYYGIANTHIVDGNTHNLIGNAPQSLRQYQLADSIYKSLKDPLSRATAINNMGTIHFFQGDYNQAIRLFSRCKNILDSTGTKSSLLITVTGNLGEVYMEKGIWEESERWLTESLALAKEMGSTRQEWGNKVILGKLKYKQGKYQESILLLEQAMAAFEKSDEKMAIAECATNLGKAYRELDQNQKATSYFNQSLAIYRNIGSRKHIWEPLYQLAMVEKEQKNNQLSISYLREAVDTLETLSGEIVGDASQKRLFAKANDKKDIYQSLITQLVENGNVKDAWVYQEKLNIYGLEEQTRGDDGTRGAGNANDEEIRLAELELKKDGIYNQLMKEKAKPADQRSDEKIEELEKRMSIASEDYQNFFWDMVDAGKIDNDFTNTINPEELDQMRYDLDEDMIILEYLVTEDQLIIFAASADTLGAKIIDVTRDNLETFVDGYYSLLVNKAEFEAVDAASEQLYQALITPVEPLLKDKKKIAFVPTGVLFKLPFQSLGMPIEEGMRYLIQDYQIFYLNDIRSTMVTQTLDASQAKLLAFGNADRTLPFAEKEVNTISGLFTDATVYVKDDAREDLAKTSMNNYTIVHFATHGNLDPVDFNNSYLTMAPNLDAGEDGKLTMREINRIRTLRSCQLIVLSACNTAVNDEKLEGWINNPAKAFLRKGAKTTVASLWSVDDAATGKLMQAFYSNLKQGQNKLEALNNAQKSLVESEFFAHPYYWAAFELIGQWE